MHNTYDDDFDSHHQHDGFDQIPDDIILLIFNKLSDIKSLTRCRSVTKRFNLLVPQVENIFIKVDCVISSETGESILVNVLKSLLQSLHDLISPKQRYISSFPPRNQSSPSEILKDFDNVKRLEIELPSGDLRLEKGIELRWKAEFGKSLKTCVILAVRSIDEMKDEDCVQNNGDDMESNNGLKVRVVWTISALIAASTRHYLLREVIKEHKEIEDLVLRDREGEGTVVMNKQGLGEFRKSEEEGEGNVTTVGWKNRTTVPAVRMRMRHAARIDLPSGVRVTGATLVVIKPADGNKVMQNENEEQVEDTSIALGVFEGVYGEVVGALLKKPSYLLEMNSF